MNLVFLDNQNPEIFPDPNLSDADGLVALSTDLGTTRLVAAYRQGIFPWMKMEEPPFLWCWYSPNPRMMLYPKEFKISRSLARALKDKRFEVRIDHNFAGVMRACASIKRPGQQRLDRTRNGARIWNSSPSRHSPFHRGIFRRQTSRWTLWALSGQGFFGESMFHQVSEASKVCMAKLVEIATQEGFHFIDCQVPNSFLQGLGAREIERSLFSIPIIRRH